MAEVGPPKIDFAEVGSVEVGSTEVSFCEVGIEQASSAEVGSPKIDFAEVGKAEFGSVEVGMAEVGLVEVGPIEVGSTEVNSAAISSGKVKSNISMLVPPFVPCYYSLFEDGKLFLVCYCVSPSFFCVSEHPTSFLDPDSGVFATLYPFCFAVWYARSLLLP